MHDKKPEGLSGHIASPNKYDAKVAQKNEIADMDKAKTEFENLKKKIVKKFPFTISLSILPAQASQIFEEDEGLTPEEIAKKPTHLLLVIPEDEYKNIPKIKPEVIEFVKESKQNLWIHIKTPVDVWNYGLDSKYEFLDAVGASYPLHDTGLLGALRVANIHKTLVLRKFEKYVASYVIGGSLARGTAGKDSDVDTFVVIDDTDVKKMPRLQLLEKLRGIIYDYIREASALAGVKNILNVQVYLLTDFWQSVKDAHPVMFTFIRDGVPMYDRGTFLPWKLLLKMGKIKPSPEAVDMFMKSGEQTDSIVKRRMIDAMVDIYWGVVTPTQALMMLAGEAPPVPKTIVAEVKKKFVDEEKIMSMSELKFLEKVVGMYKDYEHGKLNELSGKQVDEIFKGALEYDKKLKELRKKLEARLIVHNADKMESEVVSLLQNLFGKKSKEQLIKIFEKEMVKTSKISPRFGKVLKSVLSAKSRAKKISQNDMDSLRRDASELVNAIVEYSQRKELVHKEKVEIESSSGKAEVFCFGEHVFVVDKEGIKKVSKDGLTNSNKKELEEEFERNASNVKRKIPAKALRVLKEKYGEFDISVS